MASSVLTYKETYPYLKAAFALPLSESAETTQQAHQFNPYTGERLSLQQQYDPYTGLPVVAEADSCQAVQCEKDQQPSNPTVPDEFFDPDSDQQPNTTSDDKNVDTDSDSDLPDFDRYWHNGSCFFLLWAFVLVGSKQNSVLSIQIVSPFTFPRYTGGPLNEAARWVWETRQQRHSA